MKKFMLFALCLPVLCGCGAGDYISEADCQALCDKNLECDPGTNISNARPSASRPSCLFAAQSSTP